MFVLIDTRAGAKAIELKADNLKDAEAEAFQLVSDKGDSESLSDFQDLLMPTQWFHVVELE